MKKRVLALILTFSMVFTMLNSAFAADISGTRQRSVNMQLPAVYAASPSDFTDLPDDWSRGAIERAIENGLLSGANGKINAGAQLTRAELAAIVVRAFGTTETASLSGFSDVNPSDWYYDALQKAVAMGILSGNNGKLNPTAPITREEVCAVLHRAFLLQDGGNAAQKFGDAARISDWAQAAVAAMAAKGYIAGDSAGNVNASKTITRAEFAQMMDNLVKGYPSGAQGGVIEGNAVMKAGQSLSGMTIKGDLILADGLGRNDVDLSNCIVEGRVIVRGGNVITLSGTTRAGGVVAAASMGLTNNTGSKIDNISVVSDSATITLSGAAGKVEVLADNVTIRAESGAKVDIIEIAASGTTIEGSGAVAAVTVKPGASNTTVTTNHTNITVENGGGTVHSNNGSLSAGETGTTDNKGALKADNKAQATTNSSSSGSSGNRRPNTGGSSGGGSSSTTRYTVAAANGQTIGTFERGTILTVDLNGGGDNYTVTVSGSTLIATPVRAGYTFNGWLVKGTTITAQWTESGSNPALIEVRDSEGRPIGAYAVGTQLTVDPANEKDEPYTFTVEADNNIITVPTREGYLFNRWLPIDNTVTADWRKELSVMTVVRRDDGQPIGSFEVGVTLTVDPNNGTDEPYTVIVEPDLKIVTPRKEGYYFVNWRRAPLTTLTAQWSDTPIETGEVWGSEGRFIANHPIGTVLTVNPDNGIDEPYTVIVEKKTVIQRPEKEGYDFDRWEPIGTDIKALWIKKEPVMIEVRCSDGHTVGNFEVGVTLTVDPANGTAPYTRIVQEGLVIQHPVREGYTFEKWNRNPLTTITAVWTENEPVTGDISLVKGSTVAKIYISEADPNYDGISLIAEAAADDIEAVTGKRPEVVTTEPESGVVIVAGTVDADIITAEGLTWDIASSGGSFKDDNWERYQIQVKQNADKTKIVIAGADKRGTIYGLFHITQDLCGVSPWIYWADTVPVQKNELTFTKAELETVSKRASVNYRGIFLNDENPSLDGYADSHFGGLNYMFYDEVFELMLRLKANYLWPAMWTNNFNLDGMEGVTGTFADLEKEYHAKLGGLMYVDTHPEDPNETGIVDINALGGNKIDNGVGYMQDGEYPMYLANAVLADRYGIVVGMSHHEPMARSGPEWGMFKNKYYQSAEVLGNDKGVWNFLLNPTNISNFWSDAIARNGSFDNLLTIGMRGENDSALKDENGNNLSTAENIELLKKVLKEQDQILKKFGLQDTPQVIALYKEVENCWYGGDRNNPQAAQGHGLRDDSEVTELLGKDTNRIVMFCEDNNGYLRTLPEYGQGDDFNWGMYYHFDYVGGPHTSMWMNTMPLQRTWDNMTTTYEYGVDDAWIVNVGDLKPMELPISYFLDMAYDFETYGSSNPNSVDEYTQNWVAQQFAAGNLSQDEVNDITALLNGYTKMTGDRKPERMLPTTYSTVNYNEAQEQIASAIALETLADQYLEKFKNTELYDAFYELVYYPAAEAANIQKILTFNGLNQLYASRGSMLANVYADMVEQLLDRDRELTAKYNQCGPAVNGHPKWYRMMVTSPYHGETVCGLTGRGHLNYTSWNAESTAKLDIRRITGKSGSELIVDVQGVENAVTSGEITMPDFENTVKQAYALTLSNGGNEALERYEITNVPEWIKVDGSAVTDKLEGGFYTGKTYGISVDWEKVAESKSGSMTITCGGQSITVKVNAKVIDTSVQADPKAAFPSNGEVSIVANHYSSRSEGVVKWTELENYGKTGATMKMLSAHTDDFAVGKGPWIEYKAYIPADQAGSYKLTVFFGQSNNVSFDEGDHLNIGLQVNGGNVETKNTLNNGYVSGGYTGWDSNILNCGHTMDYGSYTLSAGENTIRIYGMDQNVMLQKLVLSKDGKTKTSYRGPQQSYMNAMGEVPQQPLVCHVAHEAMFLPGTIAAKDCSNTGITVTDGLLSAASGTTYTYPVKVTASGKYLFNVTGKGSGTVTLKINGRTLTYALSGTEESIPNETDITLTPGDYTLEMTVSGSAQIRSIMGEIYDDTPGIAMTISGTGGDDENVGKAFDRKNSSAWKPTESNPTITLNLSEKAYADQFVLNGDFGSGTTVKLEVSSDNSSWTEAYSGDVQNGARVWFQTDKSLSGRYWKFSFTGTVSKLSEIELNTYINWAMEDKGLELDAQTGSQAAPSTLKDGDRMGHEDGDAWIANGTQTVTMTFSNVRTLTGVNMVAPQTNGSTLVTPSDTLATTRGPKTYKVSYQKADGSWVESAAITTQDDDRRAIKYHDFGEAVTAKAVKFEFSGSQAARLMEIELLQSVRYTLNGIDRTTQNWALSSNGGTVTSYTSADGSGAKEYPKLNDGNAASNSTDNSTRERFDKPTGDAVRYVEIQLSDTVKFSQLIMFAQRGVENDTTVKEPTETARDSFQITPASVEYFDGAQWKKAGDIAKVDGGYRDSIGKVVFNFSGDSGNMISNRVRVKWDSTASDVIRLIELQVFGEPADMPAPEEPDPTEGLTNVALKANGGSVTVSKGEGNNDPAENSKLNDGVTTSGANYRWRTNTFPAYVEVAFNGTKEIQVIDVFGQSDTNDVTPTFGETSNAGLNKLQIQIPKGNDWETIVTGDDTRRAAIRYELETAVVTNKIRIYMPTAISDNWARFIEIQVWGKAATESQADVAVSSSAEQLEPQNLEMAVGEELSLPDLTEGTILSSEDAETTYSIRVQSSDSDVAAAAISKDGTVMLTGVAEGTAEIMVQFTLDDEVAAELVLFVTVSAEAETPDGDADQEDKAETEEPGSEEHETEDSEKEDSENDTLSEVEDAPAENSPEEELSNP